MACIKWDSCGNYPAMCESCHAISAPFEETPYYSQKKKCAAKFKIFFGNSTSTTADSKLNAWLEQHPNVCILSYQYQQARMGDHSICIMYEGDAK